MRVLILTDAFWPDQAGGISKAVLFETEELVRMGREVVAVGRRLARGTPIFEARAGFELHRFSAPPLKSFFGPAYPLATLLNLPRLLRRLHAERAFDVAYVNNVFQARALLGSGIAVPMVYVFHASAYREVSIDVANGRYGSLTYIAKATNELVRPIERSVIERADNVLTRSEFMRDEMLTLYGESSTKAKSRVIPLGIDTSAFCFQAETSIARRKLGLSEDSKIILTVRRLVARMGLDNLIQAMRRIVNAHPSVKLLIGGVGYLDSTLRRRIVSEELQDHVVMLGFIPDDLLPSYYQAADLFVLPTEEYEGFGMSTLEALSSGTPAMVTAVGANPEVVSGLDRRLLIAGTSAEAIADSVVRWFDDGAVLTRSACRDYCVQRFSVSNVCAEIDSMFTELASRG